MIFKEEVLGKKKNPGIISFGVARVRTFMSHKVRGKEEGTDSARNPGCSLGTVRGSFHFTYIWLN